MYLVVVVAEGRHFVTDAPTEEAAERIIEVTKEWWSAPETKGYIYTNGEYKTIE